MAPAVADGGVDGATVRARIRDQSIARPDLLRVEVMSVVRRHTSNGALTLKQATAAIDDLLDLPISVFPTALLMRRMWELRDNVTPYDSCYFALAVALDCPLLTADVRLANSPGTRCAVELI